MGKKERKGNKRKIKTRSVLDQFYKKKFGRWVGVKAIFRIAYRNKKTEGPNKNY